MLKKVKIIATIGPGSNKPEILEKLKDRKVDFFRINLSHTEEEDIEQRIKDLLGYNMPIILDTEGSQVRTGNSSEIEFLEGNVIKLHSKKVACDAFNLFLKPLVVISKLKGGDLISLEFNSVLLRVIDDSYLENGYIICQVAMGGKIGGKKAVQIESPTFSLPPFSKKDHLAIELAKKYGIKHFTLSFMESSDSVIKFRQLYPETNLYSKIESKKGLDNFIKIAEVSDGVLIDRGDLSSQITLEKIPFIQKLILNKVREMGKEAFVATNTLEQMAFALKPSKAEVNDIINTILDGATGIALTKETAIGKYPVETVNMLSNLISQVEFIQKDGGDLIKSIERTNYAYSEETPELLIKPHGGKLIDRYTPNYKEIIPKKSIDINEEALMDIEQIALGSFSPLEGFLGSKDFHSVVNNYRLSNGVIWPIPIVLAIDDNKRKEISEGENIALKFNGEICAILHLDEIYEIDKKEEAQKLFGTLNLEHPGVKNFLALKEHFLGGRITLLKKRHSNYKVHELTPKQTRKIFSERGWSKVIGFHTRNVIHKSHEFIQIEGMRKGLCDGLFVHPIIGKKKSGDFEAEIIIKSYEKMIEEFYPKSKVIFGTFATYSRYGGPREALFTALCRKNFGCSHFIIGRDHTGFKDFYHPNASHEIFKKFTKEELGIEPIMFGKVFYSDLENKHINEPEFIDHPEENKIHISGTQARQMLLSGQQPPEWFMRPEISKIIIDKIKNGEKVFVE
ncbi:MAG: sulfate adenylyltransferase [Nanoarchaeota archaeon]